MASRPKHFERLLGYLRRKGRSHEDAEDLIQEAMLRLHVYCQAEEVMNEEAFLRQAVHNLSIDQHRRDRPDLRRTVSLEDINERGLLVAPGLTPDQILEAQQRLDSLGALLDAVNPRTREIYFAHRSGYSYAEIARHMGISEITIERHIACALMAIMENGEKEPGESDSGIPRRRGG